MDHKIIFTENALTDLQIIIDFISDDNPDAASRLGLALLDHVELLRKFPRMGVPVPRAHGVRKLLHTPIRIYYRIKEELQLVEVLHFWHVGRKPPRL